jgi:hypothetical protein
VDEGERVNDLVKEVEELLDGVFDTVKVSSTVGVWLDDRLRVRDVVNVAVRRECVGLPVCEGEEVTVEDLEIDDVTLASTVKLPVTDSVDDGLCDSDDVRAEVYVFENDSVVEGPEFVSVTLTDKEVSVADR